MKISTAKHTLGIYSSQELEEEECCSDADSGLKQDRNEDEDDTSSISFRSEVDGFKDREDDDDDSD